MSPRGAKRQPISFSIPRANLLSALIGIAVAHGQIALDATFGGLGIDDNPPSLTADEEQATVRDLLEARSGVYHGANYETADMAARRPPTGPSSTRHILVSQQLGTSMRLVAIYERAVGTPAFAAFAHQIATPIGMQDFDPARCRYVGGPDSIYPAYVFYASARDLARFGLLYLRRGRADRMKIDRLTYPDTCDLHEVAPARTGHWQSFRLEVNVMNVMSKSLDLI